MKKFICGVLFISQQLTAQNLIPNPGFEIIADCSVGGITNLPPWDSPTNGTSDPYNACEGLSGIGVPNNLLGHQYPYTGNGYVGSELYETGGYREYIQIELDTPLLAEQEYCASFYANLANKSKFACNNFGMFFSNTHILNSTISNLNFTPQINDTNTVSDTANWTLIYGHFTAVGGERYLIIGNFHTDSLTDTTQMSGNFNGAYYFIDDVNVHCCSCDSLDHTGINELSKSSDAFNLYPNPNNGNMTLDYKLAENETGVISIYDITGKLILSYPFNSSGTSIKIENAQLNAGAYFYQVKVNDRKVKMGKLIIVK